MTKTEGNQMIDNITDVPPPGYFIREELLARDWSQRDLAYVLGVPEQAVNLIISGKRGITADMAKALAGAFDVPPEFFANLQKAYDLSQARDPDPNVVRKARLQSQYPIREMIKRGWLTDANVTLLEAQVVKFFDAPSLDDVPHLAHAAKKSAYDDVTPAQLAWLYRARQIAKEMPLKHQYSEKALREALNKLRGLMFDPEEARHVPRILAEVGIRYIIVETLPTAKIDGACFWLGKAPVIGMSLRYDRIDNYWFVLRHEIEHVLQSHGRTKEIIDTELEGEKASPDGNIPVEERIANAAASEFCVPTHEMDSFIKRKNPFFSDRDVLGLAKRLQVHPGIVAGQLRRRLDKWSIFSKMLVRVRSHALSGAVVDGWGQIAPVTL
ncbi:HigA family addiction module antitoxin [Candidatus Nitrospira nitrosa]|nr:HigA family addiction module antitoxin [Candidatus Nitrospira nitrosa]